jgi:type IV secretion system protein VirB11
MSRQLGARICGALEEPDTIEVMLNPGGTVWIDRLGHGMKQLTSLSPQAAETLIGTVAGILRAEVTRENPILECELPIEPPFSGARFEGLIPPVVSAPAFCIRCRARKIFTLNDYVTTGIMRPVEAAYLRHAVVQRLNILVSGGPAGGKTTLVNALLYELAQIAPQRRLVVIEDTAKLQVESENALILRATDTVDMQRLLRASMRLRPDSIIVGEVRGGEALTMLKAMNTGCKGGMFTVHATSSRSALTRIEQLIQEASQSPMEKLIGEAIDVIVHIVKTDVPPGRKIEELLVCRGHEGGDYHFWRPERVTYET